MLGTDRDRFVLATKFGGNMKGANGPDWGARGSRRYVRIAVEASLRRLRTDHLDLLQYHKPDGVTPIEETLAALDELVTAGQVRYVGSSNLAGWQVGQADHLATGRAGRAGSSARRTSTACSTGGPRPSWCRPARRTGSACCRSTRWPTDC